MKNKIPASIILIIGLALLSLLYYSDTHNKMTLKINEIENKKIISGQSICGGKDIANFNLLINKTSIRPGIMEIDYYDLTTKRANYSANKYGIEHAKNGGIVIVNQHMINPNTLQNARDRNISISKMLIPNTPENIEFNKELNTISNGLLELQKEKVPLMYRPYHEMNGCWFWWGCRPDEFKKLWIYTHDYMESKGVKVLWVYSVGAVAGNYTLFYPGDEYVDIVGSDIYSDDIKNTAYSELIKIQKPYAITEFGPGSSLGSSPNYNMLKLLETIKTKYPKTIFWVNYCGSYGMQNHINTSQLLNDDMILNAGEII